ncbi:heliorhodopsin HeR [soil metagenome]
MTSTAVTPASPSEIEPGRLRLLNAVFGTAHLAQAIAFVLLATDVSLDVSSTYPTGPPGERVTGDRLEVLFSYRLGFAVAAFAALSALFHFVIASPWGWPRYLGELRSQRNRFRWVEYSLSASLMIVLIAGITGISDIVALLALFGVNASMILFGWLMETTNDADEDVDWTPFAFGSIAGAIPWIGIGIYLVGGGSAVPNFVYGIYVSIFVFFNCFAVNQFLQYRRVGRWSDYLFGERAYVWLSLAAKSALAWQLYANVIMG